MLRGVNGCGGLSNGIDTESLVISGFGKEGRLMEKELVPVFVAVLISAVMQVNLIQTFAVIEITYKLLQLSLWFLCSIRKSTKHEKSPSNSTKLNGRRRKRR